MKTRTLIIISLFSFCFCWISSGRAEAASGEPGKSAAVSVVTTLELYPLASHWAEEYSRLNPGQEIRMEQPRETRSVEWGGESGMIGIISGHDLKMLDRVPGWQIVVGREIIVPVINAGNPFLEELSKKGITSEALGTAITDAGSRHWGTLLQNGQTLPARFYIVDDPSVKAGVTSFLKTDPSKTGSMDKVTREQLQTVLQQDPGAVVFCRLTDVLDSGGQDLVPAVRLMPIDKNANGRLEYMEQIYDNAQTFTRGVWIGKYPRALAYEIFAISEEMPAGGTGASFLSWVLTDGQQFLNRNGFCTLVINERQSQLDKLNQVDITSAGTAAPGSYTQVILWILAGILVIGLVAGWVFRFFRRINTGTPVIAEVTAAIFDERSVASPKGIYFDKSHTWAFMEQDGLVKAGIDDFLMHVTGPISRVELMKPGEKVTKGSPFITLVQQGKQLNIQSPVSGTIRAQNRDLLANASALHSSPYSDGWVYRIEPANWLREIQFLFMAEKYRAWLSGEFSRLKDFLTDGTGAIDSRYARVVMQDGGALKENLLSEMGPEVWEEFQKRFLDSGH